jgi:DNA-binding HxlR family transcriptional regulator
MFIPDETFKGIIFQELEKGDKSISSLHRLLAEEGHKVHRLVLTGYLKAMEEMGVLSSRDFPPSKVYSVSLSNEKDIYETVKIVSANLEEISQGKRHEIILYFFQKLFKRPVFQEELARAGCTTDPESFAVRISNEERIDLKKTLAKKGIKIPMKDQAYVIHDNAYDAEFDMIIQQLILEKFKATGLAIDTKQTKLGV